jgi:hypothetical protein
MSELKRVWTKVLRFVEAMEDAHDPRDVYILSLGKRVEKLEHAVQRLEGQLHSSHGGGIPQ